ncbi:MAG: hypothetical protein GY869_08930, partial [Planctomycetes bacterium]|nr:hypothetical protein [Planctomycetota bacterium]
PNNWNAARVPIQRGKGTFAHYCLPADKPDDRHKWFFSLADAQNFIQTHLTRQPKIKLIEERICEKPRNPLLRLCRRLRYPKLIRYLNRFSHTGWFVIEKTP